MKKIKGALQIICGLGLWAFGITIGTTWIGLCFGTIVIGVLLLVLAPWALILPFTFGIIPGNAMLASGLANFLAQDVKQTLGQKSPSDTKHPVNPSQFVASYAEAPLDALTGKPTWIRNKEKVREFATCFLEESTASGVAETYACLSATQKEYFGLLLCLVAIAEGRGFDFEFQKQVGVAFAKRGWDRLSEEKRRFSTSVSLDGDDVKALPSQWHSLIGDETIADATCARLMQNAKRKQKVAV